MVGPVVNARAKGLPTVIDLGFVSGTELAKKADPQATLGAAPEGRLYKWINLRGGI